MGRVFRGHNWLFPLRMAVLTWELRLYILKCMYTIVYNWREHYICKNGIGYNCCTFANLSWNKTTNCRNWPWPFQQNLQLSNFDLCVKAYLGERAGNDCSVGTGVLWLTFLHQCLLKKCRYFNSKVTLWILYFFTIYVELLNGSSI